MEKSLHERKHLYSPACMTSFGIPENTWKKGEGLEPPCWHDVVLRRKDKIKLAQRDNQQEYKHFHGRESDFFPRTKCLQRSMHKPCIKDMNRKSSTAAGYW